ncbi:MAG: GNAT family protein [Gemmatimonadaceae bacterium]
MNSKLTAILGTAALLVSVASAHHSFSAEFDSNKPVTLEGTWVRLEPLQQEHASALAPLLTDEEIWRYLPMPFRCLDDVESWTRTALDNQARGAELLFVTLERATGRVVGSTRIMDIRPEHRGAEIGYTWLGRVWWRTRLNSEAKYLMLCHLFDIAGCVRVALKTDLLNVRSQRAIERLGAKREGVLRKHMVVYGGRFRDTVYFSILDDEWPSIRSRMEAELYGDG